MKIAIETKFNIGDMVYVPEPYRLWFTERTTREIVNITIECSMRDGKERMIVLYGLRYEDEPVCEDVCFATYEECAQWCFEQNRKDGCYEDI